MDRRLRRIVGAVTLAVTASVGFGLSAGAQTTGDDQTWVGQVEKHGRHYDYIGRSCPLEETDPCPDYTVRYQIVPTTTQAARALPKVAGDAHAQTAQPERTGYPARPVRVIVPFAPGGAVDAAVSCRLPSRPSCRRSSTRR